MGIGNEIHHAPRDVSLEVSTVDVDLSGNYESDKSTSLKVFSRIIQPNAGSATERSSHR